MLIRQLTPDRGLRRLSPRDRSRPRRIERLALISVMTALVLVAPASARTSGASAIKVLGAQHLDSRLTEYSLSTPALKSATPVRVLLPTGYAQHPHERYPVLYLLHGCCNYDVSGAASWSVHGDVEAATAGLPLIVVMPDGAEGGMYTNWFNNGSFGPPRWETYHIGELIPWVDSQFRTRSRRSSRAIAGLSMGGFGAMSYAARHPDLFVFAASYSGAVDNHDATGDFQAVDEALAAQDGGAPGSLWGPDATDSIRWEAHNPVDLAANLRGLALEIRTGNGLPGGPYGGGPDPVEMTAERESIVLNQTLDGLDVAHVWDDYGPGAHQWPYWARDLRETLPNLMATFAHPPAPPAQVTFSAVEPRYEVYGWHVAIRRPVLEFSTLTSADRRGFSLAGSGTALVTTPPLYRSHRRMHVQIVTQAGRVIRRVLRVGARRRLTIPVGLGPANPTQQGAPGATTRVYTTRVSIAP
jgi:S-formylglutathione hydrolase FrmB